jgi:hypothetical protein
MQASPSLLQDFFSSEIFPLKLELLLCKLSLIFGYFFQSSPLVHLFKIIVKVKFAQPIPFCLIIR